MFFAFFLVGTIKAKAAVRYQVCHYRLDKADVSGSNSEGFVSYESVYTVYIDGKFRAAAANNADQTTGTLVEIGEKKLKKILEFSGDPGNSCPSAKFIGYRHWGAVGIYSLDGFAPSSQRTVFSKDLSDKTCDYDLYREGRTAPFTVYTKDKFTTTIEYESTFKNNDKGLLGNGNFNINSAGDLQIDKIEWTFDNKSRSEMASFINFIESTQGGCPTYKASTQYQYTNSLDTIDEEFFVFRYSTCEYKNNNVYNSIISWQNSNYSAGDKKVKVTLDKKFAEELASKYNTWENLFSGMNESQKVNCATTDITDIFDNMLQACNKESTCMNDETKKAAQSLDKLKNKLGGLDIDIDMNKEFDCKGLFGDPNNPDSFISVVKKILLWIRIAVPILVIVLGFIDFSKVIVSQDPDALKKATSSFSKRCVAAIIIFFIPLIISLIMGWINDYVMSTDKNCISVLSYIVTNIRR